MESLPEKANPRKPGPTLGEQLDAEAKEIEDATNLASTSVDPAYKDFLKQSIRDSVTNTPDLGASKFMQIAEKKAIRSIFARAIEIAKAEKLPQLVPCTCFPVPFDMNSPLFQAYNFSEIF